MSSAWTGNRTTWDARINRVAELTERTPWTQEVLLFYRRVLEFQKGLFNRNQGLNDSPSPSGSRLRDAIDLNEAIRGFPDLVMLVQMHGPLKLAEQTRRLRESNPSTVRSLLEKFLADPDPSHDSSSFFARILLQPQAERLADNWTPPREGLAGNRCPFCESKPQLAVIRPEGDGGKRLLLCSLCQFEWEFRRILCPACGEADHEKLPRYNAEGIPAARVEACDTCRSYLKSVDMTVDGLAVPVVDDVATTPLDLWAAEHDYRKIQANVMGF